LGITWFVCGKPQCVSWL